MSNRYQSHSHHRKSERLMRILELLKTAPLTAEQLHRNLKISETDPIQLRTVQRCLSDLKEMGKVQVNDWSRPPVYSMSNQLSPVELLMTHSALRMLYHQTPGYNPVYFSSMQKLALQLPQPAQSIALESSKEHKNKRLELGEALSAVAQGWFNQRVIGFEYLKPGGSGQVRSNELEVYFVEINRTNLGVYVIGRERRYHHKVRTFKLNRMRKVVVTDMEYKISTDFDPRDFLFNAWGVMGKGGGGLIEVHLRFKSEVAEWVEEVNYPGVKSRQHNPDGSVELRLEVGTNKQKFPIELKSWVQGWGSRVEVISPPDLRKEWLEEARQIAQYAEDDHARV